MDIFYNVIDFGIYLIIDNVTKLFIFYTSEESRFDLLLYECLVLVFLSGFLFVYHHIPYLLITILFVQIIGSIFSEKSISDIKHQFITDLKICLKILHILLEKLWNCINRRLSNKVKTNLSAQKPIPKQWTYNYPLKPIQDLRNKNLSNISNLTPSGIINLRGETSGLNSLLQSFASSSIFFNAVKSQLKFVKYSENSLLIHFVELLTNIHNRKQSIDPSNFISMLDPDLSRALHIINIGDLLQRILETLNDSLIQSTSTYTDNVTRQVFYRELTTVSPDKLNQLLNQLNIEFHKTMKLENIDEKLSEIIRFADVNWLLNHVFRSSIIKQIWSGQLLHSYFIAETSQVNFCCEPFQILNVFIDEDAQKLEKSFEQFTSVDRIDREKFFSQQRTICGRPNKFQTMISHFPELLCVRLKRFSRSRVFIDTEKIYDLSKLHFSTRLGIREFFPTLLSRYRLRAVCLQISNESSTDFHYACLYRTDRNQWFLVDDERAMEVHHIKNYFEDSYVTDNVHLVFLERVF